jgi:S1-C subfamily serine protease
VYARKEEDVKNEARLNGAHLRDWYRAGLAVLALAGVTGCIAGCNALHQDRAIASTSRTESEAASRAAVTGAPSPVTRPVSLHSLPLGLLLRDMTSEERTLRNVEQGVWVVVAVGASAIAGVREDDIILSLDNMPVRDVDSFWIQMDRADWRGRLGILRNTTRISVDIGK